MNYDIIRLPLLFILLCVLQVFVFNHFQLFGCCMPLLYIYFVLTMRKGMPRWAMMAWAFAMGLTLDTLSNTPGVAAASMTFLALMQPYVLDLFMVREGNDDIKPSMSTIGTKSFVNYTVVMTAIYCVVYFTLDTFSFVNWLRLGESIIGSTVLTASLILAADTLRHKKN